ncbi:MAG: DUF4270 family protein [Ferruginibacter sp.]
MHRRILSLALTGFICITIFNFSCTKLDTTNLGSDLIPAVDNVNTFADTFFIAATQHDYTDSTLVFTGNDQVLGKITNDPLFGTTEGKLFFQLKPSFYPYAFGHKDSIAGGLDSVVLCLSYKGFWGDSTIQQTLQVNEITDNKFRDSVYNNWHWSTFYEPAGIGALVGTRQLYIPDLAKYTVYNNKIDSVSNQIRIKLSQSFADRLFASDSIGLSGAGNHVFLNDSIFRHNFNGLAVTSVGGGNALMYINYADTNTKLEVHYRMKNAGKIDTTYRSFKFRAVSKDTTSTDLIGIATSAYANYINRNRAGSASTNPAPGELYLQTQPGTYADLSIPGLTGYSNRIIHRAEIIVEQITDPFTDKFVPPNYLYIDLKDSTTPLKYKPIYYDLNPTVSYDPDNAISYYTVFATGGPDFGYFGGYKRTKTGPFGESMSYYNFNVTKYVQRMVIDQSRNYDMRLFPAYSFRYPQYSIAEVPYNNSVALGRVRVGNGENPNYRMRIRIIWSPIK